jgi:hypothetical protein
MVFFLAFNNYFKAMLSQIINQLSVRFLMVIHINYRGVTPRHRLTTAEAFIVPPDEVQYVGKGFWI